MRAPGRPGADEYPRYHGRYVDLVPDGDVLTGLRRQGEASARLAAALTPAEAALRYAPGKWSAGAVLGHVADTERVMALRLLWAARRDAATLPAFDQDAWADAAGADALPPRARGRELRAVRSATLSLARTVPADAWGARMRTGDGPITARALLYVIAGHELHHARVLAERYGLGRAGRPGR